MHDPVDGDVGLVHLGVGDPGAVGRPPPAPTPIELLLGHELGETVRATRPPCSGGDGPQRAAAVGRHDVDLGVEHEAEEAAVGRQARVEHRVVEPGEQGAAPATTRDVDDLDAVRSWDDQAVGRLGPRVAGDADAELALALAPQLLLEREVAFGGPTVRPGHHGDLAGRHVLRPQLAAQAAIGAVEVRQVAVVRAERERSRLDHARQRVPGDVLEGDVGCGHRR